MRPFWLLADTNNKNTAYSEKGHSGSDEIKKYLSQAYHSGKNERN